MCTVKIGLAMLECQLNTSITALKRELFSNAVIERLSIQLCVDDVLFWAIRKACDIFSALFTHNQYIVFTVATSTGSA